jgi:hypothetical protein
MVDINLEISHASRGLNPFSDCRNVGKATKNGFQTIYLQILYLHAAVIKP